MTVYRWALVLSVLVVANGTVFAAVEVAQGIADERVEYRGGLDAHEILTYYHDRNVNPPPGYQYLSDAEGVITKPSATDGDIAGWAVGVLAPWVLAVVTLVLLWPIVRRAERGDPFWDGATRRLAIVGQLLLVGIPLVAVWQSYMTNYLTAGTGISPSVSTSISVSVWHFLPGVAVLVLAGVFKRGAELREFEQHAI
jgi:DUF2975 family protein